MRLHPTADIGRPTGYCTDYYTQSSQTTSMSSRSEKYAALLATSTTTDYNFHHDYSVVLDHPISEVFPILAHGDNIEPVVRLSSLCTDFELFDSDVVVTPNSTPLAESRV